MGYSICSQYTATCPPSRGPLRPSAGDQTGLGFAFLRSEKAIIALKNKREAGITGLAFKISQLSAGG